MCRLSLDDNMMDVMVKMSDGNPGALNTMMQIIQEHDSIDPQAFMGGLGAIMMLDTWGIYGTDIYIIFNDKCDRNVRTMLMLMRAAQLGFFSHTKLQEMAADQMGEINLSEDEFSELDKKVCEQLSDFAKSS